MKTKLEEAAEALIEMYIKNRGNPESEFISCITPGHAQSMTPKERKHNSVWKAWDDLRFAMGEHVVYPKKNRNLYK